ncbi:hypothetical protein [Nitrosospira multiformis]|uniref:hypothetical protein n=1 Tax=Nitrosospira multiformis TaxID=1231 RepID=UPI00089740A1|nr:hypothetical protein [Nitrosospira multiformis]SEA74083.1 hypothetical protein SAMN05216411_12515 [Nitrosospira multiformis]
MSQNRDDLPWFPMYASNIVADRRYRLMSIHERALWISILMECWPNGSVPADPDELARCLGYPFEDVKAGLTERVLSFFKEVKGELISPQLEKHHEKHKAIRNKQSEGGKKGVKLKREKALHGEGQPIGKPQGQPKGEPEGPLNTIKSNPIKSNQIRSLEKGTAFLDSFVTDMEEEEARIETSSRTKVRI